MSRLAPEIHPATPDRLADLEALFGPRGACGGCFCMWWRLDRRTYEAKKGPGNRRALRALVRRGPPPGLLAYHGDRAVGWIAIAPRTEYPRLDRSRTLARVDDAPVWSVSCFFVARGHRGRGLTRRLLEAALDHVRDHGGGLVEAYPVDPRTRSPDAFVYTGLARTFLAAGFTEVARRSPTRPILRRRVRARRA